jgi:hypothetical protein
MCINWIATDGRAGSQYKRERAWMFPGMEDLLVNPIGAGLHPITAIIMRLTVERGRVNRPL